MGRSAIKGFAHFILVVVTGILAAITVIAAYAGDFHPEESMLITLLGMFLPVLLVINIIVALCWGIARKWWILIPLAAMGGCHHYLSTVCQFHPFKKVSLPVDSTLTVSTYNVHSFGNEFTGYSCKKIAEEMQQRQVDILCFQEFCGNQYFSRDSLLCALSPWEHHLIPAADSTSSLLPIAVFSRYPSVNGQFIIYPDSKNCSMICDVTVGTDTLRIINNHLQTTSISQNRSRWEREWNSNDTKRETKAVQNAAETLHRNFVKRAHQADSICNLALQSPYPVIMCGDFNSIPSSYTYRRLAETLEDGFKSAGSGYMYTYKYGKRLLRIDYIFHSAELKAARYYSPNLNLCSDHNPVIMSFCR